MARRGVIVVLVVCAFGWTAMDASAFSGLPASTAAKKAKACKKGAVKWTVNKKPRCVRMTIASVRPSADPDPRIRLTTESLTRDVLGAAINKTKGRKVPLRTKLVTRSLGRNGATKVLTALRAVRDRTRGLRSLTQPASRRARAAAAPGRQTFAGPNGESAVIDTRTGEVDVTKPIDLNGDKVEVFMEGNVITGDLETGAKHTTKRLRGVFEFRTKDSRPTAALASCPTKSGKLNGVVGFTHETTIIEYASPMSKKVVRVNHDSYKLSVTVDADVGDDAFVSRAGLALKVKKSTSATEHTGLFRGTDSTTSDASASATVDPAAMRAGAAQPFRIGSAGASQSSVIGMTFLGLVGPSRSSQVVNLLKGQLAAEYNKLIADGFKHATDGLRKREEHFRTPNNCANILFEPAPGAKVKAGESLPVAASAHANAGGGIDASWQRTAQPKGEMGPKTVALSEKAALTAKGAEGVKPGEQSVSATYKATSRAGIAERTWDAKVPKGGLQGTISVRMELAPDGPGTGTATFTGQYDVRSGIPDPGTGVIPLYGSGDESIAISYNSQVVDPGHNSAFTGSARGAFHRIMDAEKGGFLVQPAGDQWKLSLFALLEPDLPLTEVNMQRIDVAEVCNPGTATTTTILTVGGGVTKYTSDSTGCPGSPGGHSATEDAVAPLAAPAALWSQDHFVNTALCPPELGTTTLCPQAWTPGTPFKGAFTSTPRLMRGGTCLTGYHLGTVGSNTPSTYSRYACQDSLWSFGWKGPVTISWDLKPV